MKLVMKRTGLAAGALAVLVGGHMAAAGWAAADLKDTLLTATALRGVSATVANVSVNPLTGKAVISGLALGRNGATVRIGKVTGHGKGALGLISPAQAADSSYTMDDVEIAFGDSTITAEELVVEDASYDEDALQDLFDTDNAKDLIAGLKGLSFRAVRSPEVVFAYKVGGNETSNSYKDVSFERMKNGKAERFAALSAAGETKMPAGTQKTSQGLLELRGVDLVVMTRFWGDKPNPGDTLAVAYESSKQENFKATLDGKFEMSIGKMESGAVRLKPMSTPISAFITMATAKKPGEKPNAEESKQMLGFAKDVFDSISDDGVEMRDMRVVSKDAASPLDMKIDRVAGSMGGGKVPGGFRIEGVSINAPSPGGAAMVKLGLLSTEGFSFRPTLEGVTKAIEAGDPDMKKVDPRTLVPQLGTITIKGIEVDAPDPKAPAGAPAERISLKLGNFQIGAAKQIRGIPTDVNFALDNLTVKLPENSPDENIKQIKALGYSALDLSAKITAKWDEAKKEIALSEVSVGGAKMGTAKLSGAIGNIGREVFESDAAMAQIALMGATAKSLSLRIENTGLAENLLALQARTTGSSADEIRTGLGSMAALGIPAILGPSDDAKTIANAIAKFLGQLKTLTIEATSKNAGGIGIPDIATAGDPQKALSLVNIKASAD